MYSLNQLYFFTEVKLHIIKRQYYDVEFNVKTENERNDILCSFKNIINENA